MLLIDTEFKKKYVNIITTPPNGFFVSAKVFLQCCEILAKVKIACSLLGGEWSAIGEILVQLN